MSSGETLSTVCLFSRMINQGANVREIKSVFVKFFKRHETIFSKFNKTSEQIIVELKF